MITKNNLESLGFKVSGADNRLIGTMPVNSEIFESGLYCDFLLTVSIRQYREDSNFRGDFLFVHKYNLCEPQRDYTTEELSSAEKTTVYEGLVEDKKHLQKILSDTVFNNKIRV